jgi:hypothetical protein
MGDPAQTQKTLTPSNKDVAPGTVRRAVRSSLPCRTIRAMSSSEKLDLALAKLKNEGREIGAKGTAAISPTGETLILIDGQSLTVTEILEMAGWPDLR